LAVTDEIEMPPRRSDEPRYEALSDDVNYLAINKISKILDSIK
jgi:hypothetical protein